MGEELTLKFCLFQDHNLPTLMIGIVHYVDLVENFNHAKTSVDRKAFILKKWEKVISIQCVPDIFSKIKVIRLIIKRHPINTNFCMFEASIIYRLQPVNFMYV